ncbi:MAG: Hsp20/alpha crystallin family protein [Clostridia bacterium]|nr:Hsp20/alpha crystallin family protein [Clostridia bacterium]
MSTLIPYTFRRNNLSSNHSFFDDDFFRPFFMGMTPQENFRVSVRDAGDRYELEAELPGVQRDQLGIDVNDGVLTISAEWNQTSESNDGYVMNERRYGRMQRSFNIDGVDESAISASYTDGVLRLDLPKRAEQTTGRRIEIQ